VSRRSDGDGFYFSGDFFPYSTSTIDLTATNTTTTFHYFAKAYQVLAMDAYSIGANANFVYIDYKNNTNRTIANNDAVQIVTTSHNTELVFPPPQPLSDYRWLVESANAVSGVLDQLSTLGQQSVRAAFSLRLLTRGYTGPTIRIRRSTDNVTQDFYANVAGDLGTSYNAGGTSITTWLSGATAFVVTWYDQSGGARDATQSTAANQPTLNTTKGVVDFLNSSDRFLVLATATIPVGITNPPFTFYVKHGTMRIPASASTVISSGTVSVTNQANNLRINTGSYTNQWWNNEYVINTTVSDGNRVAITYNGVNRVGYVNGTLFSAQASTGLNIPSGTQYIGRSVPGTANEYFNSELYNAFIFLSALSLSDLNTL
jgi:hypothetical protein